MLAVSNSISNGQLLLACCVLVLLYGLRAGGSSGGLRGFFLPGLAALLGALAIAARLWPIPGTYPEARNQRLAATAADQADREMPTADCVVVLDGSSVFAYGLSVPKLRAQLTAAGRKPCIISLSIAGGDHFEREYMADQTWKLMKPATHAALAKLPVLWVKELHWHYDSRPARMIGSNPDTARAMTLCEPRRAVEMASVVWESREITPQLGDDDVQGDDIQTPEGLVATIARHGVFNLFHAGQLQRKADGPTRLLKLNASASLENEVPTLPAESLRELLDMSKEMPPRSVHHEPPPWFKAVLARTPYGWDHTNTKVQLIMLPALSPVEHTYAAQIVYVGGFGMPMILGPHDQALREKLSDPACWRDPVHLKDKGTLMTTQWFGEHLLKQLETMKPTN